MRAKGTRGAKDFIHLCPQHRSWVHSVKWSDWVIVKRLLNYCPRTEASWSPNVFSPSLAPPSPSRLLFHIFLQWTFYYSADFAFTLSPVVEFSQQLAAWCECWELTSDLLQEQQVFLAIISEPSLQLLRRHFEMILAILPV